MQHKSSGVRIVPLYIGKKKIALTDLKKGKPSKEKTDLFEGEAPAPPKNAHLTYNGGPLIQQVAVYTIFWGSSWSSDAAMTSLSQQLNQFFTDITASTLIDQLAEYNVAGQYIIGRGQLWGSTIISDGAPQPGESIDDSAIQTALQSWVDTKIVPAPSADSLYFIYLDNGIKVTMEGGGSCTDFCGYHDATQKKIYYAVMPYPSCDGCLGGLSVIDALTGTSSHELCEAITDPVVPTGWYDSPNNMEIGDLCAWTFKSVAGHNVQKEWSNLANGCQ